MVILKELQIQLKKHAYSLKHYKGKTTLLDQYVEPPLSIRIKKIDPLINEFNILYPDISIQKVFLLFGMDDYGMLPEILKD